MTKFLWCLIVLIPLLVSACGTPATPTETVLETEIAALPEPTTISTETLEPMTSSITFETVNFIFQGDDPSIPIVTHNPSPAIENLYINPGAVLFHEGTFHMFFNSFTNWPGIIQVGYMTSEDGYQWQMVQDEPVFTTDRIPFGGGKADVSSMIVTEDGKWMMYFHMVGEGTIGRASAASPLGPWTVDPDPILSPGPDGAWDHTGLGWPSVVKNGSEYFMYYGGLARGGYSIGLATSSDGIQWIKYNDPETSDEKYLESDPVLAREFPWESIKLDRPRVTLSPDGLVMIYQAGTALETRGLALSDDGIHWERHPSNPVITQALFPIPNGRTWDTSLIYENGIYYYIMEIGGLSGTDLYLATHEGSLRK